MAKYCEPGLYDNAAVFTGSITTTSLTVTVLTSGQLAIGSIIAEALANTVITAYGTGAGGIGNYTINRTQTVGSATLNASKGGPSLTPSWGTAQEGDGSAQGAATPAIAEIDCTTANASATGPDTLSIAGAVLTCVASGASTNQFNAGSGTTLAANLVTAINRATNTVTVSSQGGTETWYTAKLQDWCFARTDPGDANVVQIMTRAGSARFNHATNSGVAIAEGGSWTASSTITQFAGGAGGAWGWVFNTHPVFPSAIGAGLYGLLAAGGPLAGAVVTGDIVHIRANDYSTSPAAASVAAIGPTGQGTAASPIQYIVGDAAEWSGDGVDSTLTFKAFYTGSTSLSFDIGNQTCSFDGGLKADGSPRTIFTSELTTGSGAVLVKLGGAPNMLLRGVSIIGVNLATASLYVAVNPAAGRRNSVTDCLISTPSVAASMLIATASGAFSALLERVTFDNTGASTPHPGPITPGINTTGYLGLFEPRFTNFVAGSTLIQSRPVGPLFVDIRNPALGNVSNIRGLFKTTLTTATSAHAYCAMGSGFGLRDFMLDTQFGCVEHIAARVYPTLNAVLPDGTPYSLRVNPTTVATLLQPSTAPYRTPRIGKQNTLGDGELIVTMNVAVEENISWTKAKVAMRVVYENPAGEILTETTHDPAGSALTASTATWSSESSGQVVFDDGGGAQLFDKFKFVLTTSDEVKDGSEVSIYLEIFEGVSAEDKYLFLDPDVLLEAA